jgi:hypothetical protein
MKYLAIGMSFLSSWTLAQSVSINKVEMAGEKVIVHYALQDSNPANEYQLGLYSSNDNFRAALTKVSGNVGNEVKPGSENKIEWKIMDEYGPFKGKISLEIRGKVFVPFVKIQSFDVEKKYKRGKPMDIVWKAGATNPLNIELIKGSERIMGENNLQNNGNHTLYIPASAKPGKDYRLKITDTKTSDVVYTSTFAVKPKLPLALKILPLLAVGGAVFALTGSSGSKGGVDTQTSITLPPFPGN